MKKLLIGLLSTFLLIGCSSSSNKQEPTAATEQQTSAETTPVESTTPEEASTDSQAQIGHVGDTIIASNGMQYTLDYAFVSNQADFYYDNVQNPQSCESEKGNYVVALFTVYNDGNEEYVVVPQFLKGEKIFKNNWWGPKNTNYYLYNDTQYSVVASGASCEPEETKYLLVYGDLNESTSTDPELIIELHERDNKNETFSFYINK